MPPPPEKVCTKCGRSFPATSEYWHRDKDGKNGLSPGCKECVSEYHRRYYQENKEALAEYHRRYRQENKEAIAERKRRYYQENQEALAERQRRYYQENKEALAEYQRRYQQENREALLEYQRRYRQENQEALAEYQRRYQQENREALLEYHRRYRQENKEAVAMWKRRRRARKHALPFDWDEKEDGAFALDYWHGACAFCGNGAETLFSTVHLDHYIPVSYDGDDNPGTVPENMLPTCRTCNLSKNATMPEEWIMRTFGQRKGRKIIKRIHEYFEVVSRCRET